MSFFEYLDVFEEGFKIDMSKLIKEEIDDKTGNLLDLGKKLANELKLIFNGIWDSQMGKFYLTFTDPVTQSTFISTDRNETINNLKTLRARFQ